MFKPTADNYEALTRVEDYLIQIHHDVPNNDRVIDELLNSAIGCIEDIFDELRQREYDERSE